MGSFREREVSDPFRKPLLLPFEINLKISTYLLRNKLTETELYFVEKMGNPILGVRGSPLRSRFSNVIHHMRKVRMKDRQTDVKLILINFCFQQSIHILFSTKPLKRGYYLPSPCSSRNGLPSEVFE